MIFKLAAPGDEVTRRESNLGFHAPLHICNYAAHVSAADKNRNGGHSHAGFPADIQAATLNADLGDLVQSNAQSPRGVNQDVADGAYVIARLVAYSRRHLEAFFTFPNFSRRFTTDGGLDHILYVGNVQSVTRCLLAIDLDLQLGNFTHPVDKRAGDAGDPRYGIEYFPCLVLDRHGFGTEYFYNDLPVNLGNTFQNVISNGLRETRLDARDIVQRVLDLRNELFLGDLSSPGRGGLKVDEKFRHVDRFGIGAVFRATCFGNDRIHLGKTSDKRPDAPGLACRFAYRYPRRQHDIYPEGSFVKLR